MKATNPKKPSSGKDQDKRKNKRWSHDEVIVLFHYLQDTIKKGKSIEKPTAIDYYKEFLLVNPMTNCVAITVRDKVRYLKDMYTGAVKWSNVTGQGVLKESGETTFEAALLKQFKYFKEAQEVWGSKLSIHVPYVASSSAIGPNCSNSTVAIYGSVGLVPEVSIADDVTIEDITEEPVTAENLPCTENRDEEDLTVNKTTKTKPSKSSTQGGSSTEKFLTAPSTKGNSPKTARDTYLEATKLRTDAARERTLLKKEQLTVEKDKADAEVQLRREQFEFDKEMRLSEMEFRRTQMQSDSSIRLKELEVEKMKVELELMKTKNNI